jgi:hypothetical protein
MVAKVRDIKIAGYSVSSSWAQWLLSMALGAAVTWGLLQARLSALETNAANIQTQITAIQTNFGAQITSIQTDVREIRTYLMGKKKGE